MFGIGKPELRNIERTIRLNRFTRFQGGKNGYLARSERELAKKVGVKHTLLMNSGTSSLISSLVALGVGPGDEVPVSAYTWISSPLAPVMLGATPVIVEVDETLTMCPKDLEKKLSPRTKAIIPVHMNNLPCNMDKIMRIARKHKIGVVEDACQAVGGLYKGKRLGSIGAINAYSFNSYKNITCGEGGAILTNDTELYDRARLYHDAGTFVQSYDTAVQIPMFAGQDYRASEIDGAILCAQLKRLDPGMEAWRKRRKLAAEIIAAEAPKAFRITLHNDEESAVSLPLSFADEETAKAFVKRHSGHCFIDTWRHVYTNWEPLVQRCTYHPLNNPMRGKVGMQQKYDATAAPRTLEILRRTVNMSHLVAWDIPLSKVEKSIRAICLGNF